MLSQEKVLEAVKAGKESECLDGRDYLRLAGFFSYDQVGCLGFDPKVGKEEFEKTRKPWTEAEILLQLKDDLEFGFEKSLDKRGISAGLMVETVRMWLWILEDPLQHNQEYAQYGLPFHKAVALKYNLPNPIGDDTGTEYKYSSEAD